MNTPVPAVGDTLPPLTLSFTREALVRYAGASTDFNPIHYSDHAATSLGLPGVVAHGMLTMGAALRIVTDWCGDPAAVRSYAARFSKPVPVPDDGIGARVEVTGTVSAVGDAADGTPLVTVQLTARCGDEVVLRGASVEVVWGMA